MFVYSVKGSTLKFFGALTLALTALVLLVIFVPSYGGDVPTGGDIRYSGIRTHEDRVAFLSQFGWKVEDTPDLSEKVTIPGEFDSVFMNYNDLQKEQGLDLSRYRRKEADHFRYVITNYPGAEGKVYVNLLIYRGKVIGGDISSAAAGGFVAGFAGKKEGDKAPESTASGAGTTDTGRPETTAPGTAAP